jgi:hypothetical protein
MLLRRLPAEGSQRESRNEKMRGVGFFLNQLHDSFYVCRGSRSGGNDFGICETKKSEA